MIISKYQMHFMSLALKSPFSKWQLSCRMIIYENKMGGFILLTFYLTAVSTFSSITYLQRMESIIIVNLMGSDGKVLTQNKL